jgi:DNA-binding transcriptional LysR family regulator
VVDLRQLEVFAEVVDARSFSRAAAALGLSQSTVSEHVRALEADLGVRLLDRLGRTTAATPAGARLYGYARRLLALRAEARQALEQFGGEVAGALRVGGSTIPGEYVLPALLGRFRERHPRVTVTLRIGDTRAVAEAVLAGDVEVGVVGARPDHRALQSEPLWPDELTVVVPPGHPWFGRDRVTLADLRAQAFVVREPGSGSRQALEDALEQAGAGLDALRVVAEMGSTGALKEAVKAGLGLALVSRVAVEDEVRHGLLGRVGVSDLPVTRRFHLVVHAARSRSPMARAFLEFVRAAPG